MHTRDEFLSVLRGEFPDDRLTFQKAVPTFHPENADEASAFFKLANTHRIPVFITGFGNNIDPVGKPFTDMVSVRTDRLNTLHDISEEHLTAHVGGGYPLIELNHNLVENHLMFPHAMLPYVGSIGGALAVGLTGGLHGVAVPMKKYLLEVECVTADGEIMRAGTDSKRSADGPDIARIFSPSWGLLGLLVSVTLRVMPDSARSDYEPLRLLAIERELFTGLHDSAADHADAIYAKKIKAKFDPNGILPIV